MGLNILHTADWHLGAKLYNASREEEHQRFLSWLLDHIRAEEIDLLLVAGDIFHYTQPSAEATALYYHFLARAAAETDLRQIVVVGGNHDSASRLDAPSEVLKVLNVHVVGGLSADQDTWERCLCPVRGSSGEVEAVVVAVPFVHEFRLGVRTTGMEPGEARAAIQEAFTRLYSDLADRAEARWPGVPLLTTGHMTCKGAPVAGYNTPIHLSAMIGGLPADVIFDRRYSYVALGHIHLLHNCEDSTAWYCGSPLPLNVLEARTPRYILRVALDADDPRGAATPTPIEVPVERQLIELRGGQDEIVAQLEAIEPRGDLEPYVWVDVEVDHYTPEVSSPLIEALARRAQEDGGVRPRLIRVGQSIRAAEAIELGAGEDVGPTLRDLDPEEVFVRLYRTRNNDNPPRDAVLETFREIKHRVEIERDERKARS